MQPSGDLLQQLHHGLIVSCQPDFAEPAQDPMNRPEIMAALAQAVALGGAVGIRADGPAHIAAIRAAVTLPIIGIYKHDLPGYTVRITPTVELAVQVARAGADLIAVDATARPHPEGQDMADWIHQVRAATGKPVLADISTYEEGIAAAAAGADAVLTTLSGYTDYSPQEEEPDFDLIVRLVGSLHVPVIAEGRINTPAQAARALACGAWAVTVGSAITRPRTITARFAQALRSGA